MNQEVLDLLNELRDGDSDIDTWDLPEDFESVTEGDWIQEHKYQYIDAIVKHKPTETFWEICRNRSGSYHTDWYYGEAHVAQVEPHEEVVTKTVVTWRNVE